VICRRRKEGEAALHALIESAIAAGPELIDPLRPVPTAADMSGLDPDDVEFTLSMAYSAFITCRGDEAEWRYHVTNLLGRVMEPKLPVIWAAMQRLASGASLEGLALPRVVIEAPARLTG